MIDETEMNTQENETTTQSNTSTVIDIPKEAVTQPNPASPSNTMEIVTPPPPPPVYLEDFYPIPQQNPRLFDNPSFQLTDVVELEPSSKRRKTNRLSFIKRNVGTNGKGTVLLRGFAVPKPNAEESIVAAPLPSPEPAEESAVRTFKIPSRSFLRETMERNHKRIKKITLVFILLLELYRLITSSFLIFFVPKSNNGQQSSYSYSYFRTIISSPEYYTLFVMNCLTFFTFFSLFMIEIYREFLLFKYLDVDDNNTTKVNFQLIMHIIPEDCIQRILRIEKYYHIVIYVSFIVFVFNLLICLITINANYTEFLNQGNTTTMTYAIIMFMKIANGIFIASSSEHCFYSAFFMTNMKFNRVNRKYLSNTNKVEYDLNIA